ncbi:MAG TPA: hypothetical protein VFN67_15210 [Polyangiales bacterium]|nr:hypothetical protein [Polyangiales bacterium]
MKHAVYWLGMFLTLSAAGLSHAQYTGVFPVQGTNLSDSERASIGALISNAYAERTQTSVFTPAELDPILRQAGSETQAAQLAGLYEYLHVEAVRLDTRIVLYVELRDPHGRNLYDARDTAFSLDDMELVSQRIAATLAARTGRQYPARRDPRPRPRRPAFAEKLFGVRFALVMPWARRLETQASLLCQFDVRLEQPRYFIELAAGFWLPSETNSRQGLGGFVGQLGASYYLAQGSVSPYIGLGFSPRLFGGQYEGVGLAANAHVGLMFMRESSTRLYVELRADQNLLGARRSDATDGARNDILPTELSAAVGLGF